MNVKDIHFDEYLEMSVFSEELNKEIRLVLSDSLYASEEELTEAYKSKITDFVNNIDKWNEKALSVIKQRANDRYNILNAHDRDIALMSIFILFEQDESELFGLSFRVEFDIEHGCGLKIKGGSLEIIEVGTGDIAFC